MSLPPFNQHGLLPVGLYTLTTRELLSSHLITGQYSQHGSNWNTAHRITLLHNFIYLARQLWQAGVMDVFMYGSFVDDKGHPNDIDGYFEYPRAKEIRNGTLRQALNKLNTENAR